MRGFLCVLFMVGTVLAPFQLYAQRPPSAAESDWWRGITTDGYASLSYTYNENVPGNRINQFRVFDFNDEEPQLDAAQLVIQRAAAKPNEFGFRFEVIAGSGVPEITAASGLFRDRKTGIAHHVDIPQAYLRYVAPLGKGLTLDAGKFVTHMGYEVIGGYDAYNDNFSRSFIFGYGIPFTQTGARASYTLNSRVSGLVSLTNGWDDFQRLNGGLTWSAQLSVNSTRNTSIAFNFIHGPERWHDDRDQRSVAEIVGTWKATPRWSVAVDALYGHEENGVMPGVDAIWKGVAGYAKYAVTKRFSVAARGERFRDGGGTRTGVDQALNGWTFTPEYDLAAKLSKIDPHFTHADGKIALRGELRRDTSDQGVFWVGARGLSRRQFTTAVNVIYAF